MSDCVLYIVWNKDSSELLNKVVSPLQRPNLPQSPTMPSYFSTLLDTFTLLMNTPLIESDSTSQPTAVPLKKLSRYEERDFIGFVSETKVILIWVTETISPF